MVAVALTGIAVSALVFRVMLTGAARRDPRPRPAAIRWVAFAAFLGVCVQAMLGGLRVVLDPQGVAATTAETATVFRIIHGCFAQIELCLVVALAAMLSPVWQSLPRRAELHCVARLGWVTFVFVALQLVAGATMRHLGAGLAIPTWPRATAEGGWLPAVHNVFVDLNFTHTRVFAIVVTIFIACLTTRVRRLAAGEPLFQRPALLLDFLLLAQVALGVSVIWNSRPPMLTTLHVINGAALLATTLLITLRAARASRVAKITTDPLPVGGLAEVTL